MRYLDLIRKHPKPETKPTPTTVDVASQRREFDPNAFQSEPHTAPFEVGDCLSYQVPGDPEKGPFEVVMVSSDQGGWWALVSKPNIQAWIHQIIVKAIIPKNSQPPPQ